MGESAGGASVHYHIVSKASKGLFEKAIMQSGSIACPWSYAPDVRSQILKFGNDVNCPTANNSALVSCLKKLSAKKLVLPMVDFMRDGPIASPGSMMVPSMEAVVQEDTFLSENPRILIEQGKFNSVPLLIGINSGEGGLRTSRLEVNQKVLKSIDEKWDEICPLMQYYDPKRTDASKKIREFYFGKRTYVEDPSGFLKNFTQMLTDGIFSHPIHNAAVSHASKGGPVYMYYYKFNSIMPSTYSLMKAVHPDDWIATELAAAYSVAQDLFRKYFGYSGPHEYGACHADDLFQLWKMQWPYNIGQKNKDYKFSKAFVKSMVDFAKDEKTLQFNGISWPSIDTSRPGPLKYMELDSSGKVIDEPFSSKLPFWDSLNIRNPAESHNW